MAENFYTIITKVGAAKIANAFALGTNVNITQLAVGDGNGAYYNPTELQTALVHEVWRGSIQSLSIDPQNPNWIVAEIVIPTTDGGFAVREAGIFDDAGDLIAVGKYPETYKPLVADGSAKDLYIKMIMQVSNTASVTLKVDPSIVLASKSYVDLGLATKETPVGAQAKADAAAATGVAAAGVVQDALAIHQADYVRQPAFATTTGTSTAYTATLTPALTAYATGVGITIIPHVACGASPTLNINTLGAIALLKQDGTAYSAGDLAINTPYSFKFNGTSFLADSSGGKINGIVADYLVGAGQNINAGDFVKFVNGTEITFDTPFSAAGALYVTAVALDASRILVVYRNNTTTFGNAVVLTISGSSIYIGATVAVNAVVSYWFSAALLDSSRVLVACQNGSTTYGNAVVLTIAGNVISVGAVVAFNAVNTANLYATTLDNNRVLVVYRNNGNGYGSSIVLTTAGTVVTYGTMVVFSSTNNVTTYSATTLDSGRVVVTYGISGGYGTSIVLSVAGTVITYGLAVSFNTTNIGYASAAWLDSSRVIVVFADSTGGGQAVVLSIAGTVITAGTVVPLGTATTTYLTVLAVNSGQCFVSYIDQSGSYCHVLLLSISGSVITTQPFGYRGIGSLAVYAVGMVLCNGVIYSLTGLTSSGQIQRLGIDNGQADSLGFSGFMQSRGDIDTGISKTLSGSASTYVSAVALDSNRCLVIFKNGSTSLGNSVVVTATGTTVTVSAAFAFTDTITVSCMAITVIDSSHVFIMYNGTNAGYVYSCILAVTGSSMSVTDVKSFSPPSTVVAATTLESSKLLGVYATGASIFAAAASVTGLVISRGAILTVATGNITYAVLVALDKGRALLIYRGPSTTFCNAVVLTVTGTIVTMGTIVALNAANVAFISATQLDYDKVLVVYQNVASTFGEAVVVTTTGTTVTAGAVVAFTSVPSTSLSIAAMGNVKALAAYNNGTTSLGETLVLSVNGTDIALGTICTLGAPMAYASAVHMDPTKTLLSYQNTTVTSSFGESILVSNSPKAQGLAKNSAAAGAIVHVVK